MCHIGPLVKLKSPLSCTNYLGIFPFAMFYSAEMKNVISFVLERETTKPSSPTVSDEGVEEGNC
jgi:hypothetical protein